MMLKLTVLLFLCIFTSGLGQYSNSNSRTSGCPERNGRFPTGACDAYIECVDGVAEEKLCPDGLLFNANSSFFNYPCQYPNEVDCRGRSNLQPAQSTEDCPHQFGLYKYGDARNCGQFKNCANGVAYIIDCPEGLAFNEEIYKCDWPDQVPSCDAEAYLGFSCPNAREDHYGFGFEADSRFYKSNIDCQQFFMCLNGRPRLLKCGEDEVFNEELNTCEKIEISSNKCPHLKNRSKTEYKTQSSQLGNQKNYYESRPSESFGSRRKNNGNNQSPYRFQSSFQTPFKNSYSQNRFH